MAVARSLADVTRRGADRAEVAAAHWLAVAAPRRGAGVAADTTSGSALRLHRGGAAGNCDLEARLERPGLNAMNPPGAGPCGLNLPLLRRQGRRGNIGDLCRATSSYASTTPARSTPSAG